MEIQGRRVQVKWIPLYNDITLYITILSLVLASPTTTIYTVAGNNGGNYVWRFVPCSSFDFNTNIHIRRISTGYCENILQDILYPDIQNELTGYCVWVDDINCRSY